MPPPDANTQGIAILGAGLFAKEAHLPALAALGASAPALKAVYSRSEKSAADLAAAAAVSLSLPSPPAVYHDSAPNDAHTGLSALLARPDIAAVLIVLPITLQPAIIRQALAAGKHVLSEKPVAPSVASGLSLIAEYEEKYRPKGLVWRVAENFEAEPGYRRAGKIVRDGKIGEVKFWKATVYNYIDETSKWYKTPWRTVPDYQGGFLLDGGVHTTAVLRLLLPSPLTHLSAHASLAKAFLAPHDTIHAIARSAGSSVQAPPSHGLAELTFASPTTTRPQADMFLVTGDKGWLSVNNVDGFVRITIRSIGESKSKDGGDDEKAEEKEETIDVPAGQGVRVEIGAFLRSAGLSSGSAGVEAGEDDGGESLGDPREALRDVAFIEAALTSGGREVDLGALLAGR